VVVYLHGIGGSATNWTDLAGQLGTRMRGMALDLPGFGRTQPVPEHDFTIRTHTENVCRFLAGLRSRPVHLIGNSFGGAIALRIAAQRPDLVTTLTVISPAMPDLRPDPRRLPGPRLLLSNLALLPGWSELMFGQQSWVMTPSERAERMVRTCFADPATVSERRLADVIREYTELGRRPWAGNAIGRTTMGLIRYWCLPPPLSLWRELARITAPTLVVWGAQDRLVTVRKAPRTATGISRARLLVLPRTGHIAQMERPTTVARAVLGMVEAVEAGRW
jgi:pimeloyl-ACP methyl ester carboxylesterase